MYDLLMRALLSFAVVDFVVVSAHFTIFMVRKMYEERKRKDGKDE